MREYEMINIDSIFAIFFIRYRFRIAMCVNARMQSQWAMNEGFVALWSAAKSFSTTSTACAVDLHARQMHSTNFRMITDFCDISIKFYRNMQW